MLGGVPFTGWQYVNEGVKLLLARPPDGWERKKVSKKNTKRKLGGSLVGVWNGWGYGIAFFRALNFQISEPEIWSPGLEDTVSAISGNFRKLPEIAGNLPEIAGNCWRPGGGGGQQFPEIAGNYPTLHFWAKLLEISGIAGNCRKFPEITGNFRKLPEISAIAGNCGNFRKLPATPALPDPFSTRTCPFFRPAPFSGPLFPPP